jgi:hypothetical protein
VRRPTYKPLEQQAPAASGTRSNPMARRDGAVFTKIDVVGNQDQPILAANISATTATKGQCLSSFDIDRLLQISEPRYPVPARTFYDFFESHQESSHRAMAVVQNAFRATPKGGRLIFPVWPPLGDSRARTRVKPSNNAKQREACVFSRCTIARTAKQSNDPCNE